MWKYIATPLIGAVIGYVTNWIAVKMLFRPRKEIRVFGKRLPFTPGVIPRGQGRLARAVGNVVETQLLTPEYLGEKLLSKESEEEFKSHVQSWIDSQKASEDTLYSSISNIVEEDRLNNFIVSTEESLSDFLSEKIIAMEPGKLIVDKVMQEAQNKLSESMFGMMLGGSFLEKIAGQVQDGIDTYIQENAREYVGKAVVKESKELQVNDIVVYEAGKQLVVHRVIQIEGNEVTTQGDANNAADEPFSKDKVLGTVRFRIAGAGRWVTALRKPWVMLLLIAMVFALEEYFFQKQQEKEDEELVALQEEIRKLKENSSL